LAVVFAEDGDVGFLWGFDVFGDGFAAFDLGA
jgi:hypothetical protein